MEKRNETEFAIGIILGCVGAFLLYTQYQMGYWGILGLGSIFIVKNWPSQSRKTGGPDVAVRRNHAKVDKDRLNH
jgi:hypothetical protein